MGHQILHAGPVTAQPRHSTSERPLFCRPVGMGSEVIRHATAGGGDLAIASLNGLHPAQLDRAMSAEQLLNQQ